MRFFWLLCLLLLFSLNAWCMSPGPHMAVAAGLGKISESPFIALGLGMASHIVLDAIPHNDSDNLVQAISLVAGMWATNKIYEDSQRDPQVLWGVAGGLLPDLEHIIAKQRALKKKYFPTHTGVIPHGKRLDPELALLIELTMTGISLKLVF